MLDQMPPGNDTNNDVMKCSIIQIPANKLSCNKSFADAVTGRSIINSNPFIFFRSFSEFESQTSPQSKLP